MKTTKLETLMVKHIGVLGAKARDAFEYKLKIDLLGEAIKRQEKRGN